MKLFIWQVAGHTTERHHSSAGVILIGETLGEARDKAKENPDIQKRSDIFSTHPDAMLEIWGGDVFQFQWIFPNAGCC